MRCSFTAATRSGRIGRAHPRTVLLNPKNQKPRTATGLSPVCPFWNNTGGEIVANDSGSASAVSYSDVQGGVTGNGNINSNPLFADPSSGNIDGLELQATSSCINAGNSAAIPWGTCTDDGGYSRIVDGTVDIGAFEYQ